MRFQKGLPTSEAFSKVAIFIRVFNHFNGDNRQTYRQTIGENTSKSVNGAKVRKTKNWRELQNAKDSMGKITLIANATRNWLFKWCDTGKETPTPTPRRNVTFYLSSIQPQKATVSPPPRKKQPLQKCYHSKTIKSIACNITFKLIQYGHINFNTPVNTIIKELQIETEALFSQV